MEFKIESKQKENLVRYEKEEIDLAYEFSKEAKKEFKDMIKAIILFGSTARRHATHEKSKDIDILLILDDVTVQFTQELVQAYRLIVGKIIARVSKRLHVTSLRFTNFWEYIRAGDPIAINILRDGLAIIDTGFFNPLQILLYQGRIRPSAESIQNYMAMAPQTLQNSRNHLLQATLDLYWAVIDASHAALMSINEIPPSPSHAAEMLTAKLVKPGFIDKKHAATVQQFYALGKSIMHGELLHVSGQQFDVYYTEAHEFVMDMKRFIERK